MDEHKEISNISKFLEKFKIKLSSDDDRKDSILNIINETIGSCLEKGDIKIKNGVLFIKNSPQIKSEIFMKKEKILEQLSLYKTNIFDIK
ncbi:MAG: hypothetical protein WDK96_03445 [Candidatus Paceibacterota bacterium]|jgi:hypothetical protein